MVSCKYEHRGCEIIVLEISDPGTAWYDNVSELQYRASKSNYNFSVCEWGSFRQTTVVMAEFHGISCRSGECPLSQICQLIRQGGGDVLLTSCFG